MSVLRLGDQVTLYRPYGTLSLTDLMELFQVKISMRSVWKVLIVLKTVWPILFKLSKARQTVLDTVSFMSLPQDQVWENPLYSESLNISLVSLKARLVAWLLLRNLLQRQDLNLCPYFLIDVSLSAWIPIVFLKKNSRVLLMPRLATESSSSMITLDHLILGICLVSLDT